jgi:hypothetical protein
MCCLVLIMAFLGPRVALFFTWIFSERLTIAFSSFWIGFLGFLFLPWTTLFYAFAYQPVLGVSGFGWILVAFGFVMDIASYTAGARRQSQSGTA